MQTTCIWFSLITQAVHNCLQLSAGHLLPSSGVHGHLFSHVHTHIQTQVHMLTHIVPWKTWHRNLRQRSCLLLEQLWVKPFLSTDVFLLSWGYRVSKPNYISNLSGPLYLALTLSLALSLCFLLPPYLRFTPLFSAMWLAISKHRDNHVTHLLKFLKWHSFSWKRMLKLFGKNEQIFIIWSLFSLF